MNNKTIEQLEKALANAKSEQERLRKDRDNTARQRDEAVAALGFLKKHQAFYLNDGSTSWIPWGTHIPGMLVCGPKSLKRADEVLQKLGKPLLELIGDDEFTNQMQEEDI